jgi:hypothetical protein
VVLDLTALVEVGFFEPQGPNPTRIGDPRVVTVYPAMANSKADFVSVHPYPIIGGLTFAQYVQNFGFVGYQQQKPVVLEEFGVLDRTIRWRVRQRLWRKAGKFSLVLTGSKAGLSGRGIRPTRSKTAHRFGQLT